MGKGASCLNWKELDKARNELETNHRHMPIWRIIAENPVHAFFIDGVVNEGWKIEEMHIEGVYGITSYSRKKILINQHLQGYQRDVTLFHELVHIRYPDILNDLWGRLADYNDVVCEWIARQCVADNELVYHALQKFGLESQPYDPEECYAFLPSRKALQKLFKRYWVVLYCG